MLIVLGPKKLHTEDLEIRYRDAALVESKLNPPFLLQNRTYDIIGYFFQKFLHFMILCSFV